MSNCFILFIIIASNMAAVRSVRFFYRWVHTKWLQPTNCQYAHTLYATFRTTKKNMRYIYLREFLVCIRQSNVRTRT